MNISDLLTDKENRLIHIKKRYFYLKEIEEELLRATSSKPFIPKNDIVWQMVQDSFEMLIIDFASFCKGLYCGKHNFIGQLGSCLNLFKIPSKESIVPPTHAIETGLCS